METQYEYVNVLGSTILSGGVSPGCPPDWLTPNYWEWQIRRVTNKMEPVRPDRRTRPQDLLMNPTPRGPFSSEILDYKLLESSGEYEWNCWVPGQEPARVLRTSRRYNEPAGIYPPANTADPDVVLALMGKTKSSRVNLAENIGEWRETARAVEGGANGLRNAYRFARSLAKTPRRRWPSKFRRLWDSREKVTFRDIPGAYLMATFGINPYIQLANESIEALNRRLTKPIRVVHRTSAKKHEEWGSAGTAFYAKRERLVKGVAVVDYRSDTGEFTSGNIGEAVWASLPCSFMVDWFIGVGSWLSAIDCLDGVAGYAGTVSVRDFYRAHDESVGAWHKCSSPGRVTRRSYRRDLLSFPSVPPAPTWKPSASWGKLASALAVLHELRRST